jgi:hypothetical protein
LDAKITPPGVVIAREFTVQSARNAAKVRFYLMAGWCRAASLDVLNDMRVLRVVMRVAVVLAAPVPSGSNLTLDALAAAQNPA